MGSRGQQRSGLCSYGDRPIKDWRSKREKREMGPAWMSRGATKGKKQPFAKRARKKNGLSPEDRMDVVDKFRLSMESDSEDEDLSAKPRPGLNDTLFQMSGMKVRGAGKSPRSFRAPQNPLDQPFSRPNVTAFNAVKPGQLVTLDAHFAEWFIGFVESQAPQCFMVVDGKPRFSLYHTNIPMHYKIRDNLKFGQVDTATCEWFVEKEEGILRVFSLLNGNIFLEGNRKAFKEWFEDIVSIWSDFAGKDMKVDMNCGWRPQLNNKWLMGLIDSSIGMFAARLVESNLPPYFNVDLKFWVLHKDMDLLKHLKSMFNGGEIREDQGTDLSEWTAYKYKLHVKVKR